MKIKLKANPGGQFYFPKEIREEWGHELELTPDAKAGAIYPVGMSAKEILRSLQVVIADLKHRAELEKTETSTNAFQAKKKLAHDAPPETEPQREPQK